MARGQNAGGNRSFDIRDFQPLQRRVKSLRFNSSTVRGLLSERNRDRTAMLSTADQHRLLSDPSMRDPRSDPHGHQGLMLGLGPKPTMTDLNDSSDDEMISTDSNGQKAKGK